MRELPEMTSNDQAHPRRRAGADVGWSELLALILFGLIEAIVPDFCAFLVFANALKK